MGVWGHGVPGLGLWDCHGLQPAWSGPAAFIELRGVQLWVHVRARSGWRGLTLRPGHHCLAQAWLLPVLTPHRPLLGPALRPLELWASTGTGHRGVPARSRTYLRSVLIAAHCYPRGSPEKITAPSFFCVRL